MDIKSHWDTVFSAKESTDVSWYQPHLRCSLQLISNTGVDKDASIIDVGGGDSSLVDDLVQSGFSDVTVLDIASSAIGRVAKRLGQAGSIVHWTEADVLEAPLPKGHFDVWHDRAVFHFLIGENDRHRYREIAAASIKPNGHLIIATFAADGPERCSGLQAMRYDQEALVNQFKGSFEFVECLYEAHMTPNGKEQRFVYCRFSRKHTL